ncbi:MAG: serine/threonine protein phosphatase [Alphaproteobacteria bacterium]|nr:MAG: serine/threonine protein phosphatase [Alphaproteobacteria bacterium]
MIAATELHSAAPTGTTPSRRSLATDQDQRHPSVGDRLVYAVGDIHGRLDLLEELICEICRDALKTSPELRPLVIPLGDYIDRGPQSAGVLALLVELCRNNAFEVRPLRGNHEQALLAFLDDPRVGPSWAQFGGGATLSSYGVPAPRADDSPQAWETASTQLKQALPSEQLVLLRKTEFMICVGDYAFVHAGLRPDARLDEQTPNDLMWIRTEFLNHRSHLEKRVVHGHSAQTGAQVLPWRIGIDTGAYATGVLTALRLHNTEQTLMHASFGARRL